MIGSTLTRRTYPTAPVSPLFLFDRQQDFCLPEGGGRQPGAAPPRAVLAAPGRVAAPGGYAVDRLAAGTYDRSVGLSLLTFQVTHRIAADIDVERDHIVTTVCAASTAASVEVIETSRPASTTATAAATRSGPTATSPCSTCRTSLRHAATKSPIVSSHISAGCFQCLGTALGDVSVYRRTPRRLGTVLKEGSSGSPSGSRHPA